MSGDTHIILYLRPEIQPCLKDLGTKLYGILISFYRTMKSQNFFKFGISDVILRMHKTFHPWFSLHFFLNFMEREKPFTTFYIFHELKCRNLE